MTGKADFSEQEWTLVTGAPPLAGLMVAAAQRGGTFKEALAIGKAYAEARQQHGASQLLDELIATRPKVEHEHFHSPEELREHVLGRLGEAIALVHAKATEQEVADYAASCTTSPNASRTPTARTVRRSATPSRRHSAKSTPRSPRRPPAA